MQAHILQTCRPPPYVNITNTLKIHIYHILWLENTVTGQHSTVLCSFIKKMHLNK